MLKRRLIVVASIVLIIAAAVGIKKVLVGLKVEPKVLEVSERVRAVKSQLVRYDTIYSPVVATGRLGSQVEVDVISEVPGKIIRGTHFLKKGVSFKKGDLLCVIYDQEQKLLMQSSKSRFLQSVANILPDYKIDFSESYAAWEAFFEGINIEKNLPPLPLVNNKQEKIYLANRRILGDYYSIKREEIKLRKHYIYAPFSGSITQVNLEVGAVANMGSRIARIIRTDILELEVPVDPNNAHWIKIGEQVEVVGTNKQMYKGRVIRKADFVDPMSQSIAVFVQLKNNQKGHLYEGAYLEATFLSQPIFEGMRIARSAVFNTNEVYLVKEGRIKKQLINILKVNDSALIFNGIEEGERIVVEALVNANENMSVQLAQ